jgi:2-isopropylmalate synthase
MTEHENNESNESTARTTVAVGEVDVGVDQPPRMHEAVEIFDTTLRDGSQLEGVSLSVDDKLRIAEQLDHLGVHYIEGGYPGANPKDESFFERAPSELTLHTATMVAFGSTRRPKGKADDDPTLRNLVKANTSVACIVGKCWDYHVTEALRVSLDEGVAMVRDSVEFLHSAGLRVFYDAEHFFDGYKHNAEFSLRVLEAAATAGAEVLVLCDTNGGSLPFDVERIVGEVYDYFGRDVGLGIHVHDDTGCAVANTIAGVRGGARQVQGTINGIGERTGNANLTTIIPDLTLKMGVATIPTENLERLTAVSHHVAELVNVNLNPQAAYVGQSAFAHKAGLHVSAIARRPDAYEHVDPDLVGNGRKFVVSELAGKTTLDIKAKEIGLDLDGQELNAVVVELKELENRGYHFEAADGSLELLMRRATGWRPDYFTIQQYRVMVDGRAEATAGAPADLADVFAEATIKVEVDGRRVITTAEGNGPVDALNQAMREAIGSTYPALERIHLTDFKVRILETGDGTAAVTRVLLDSTNGELTWSTIGVSENIIEASWEALLDSLVFGLLHTT